MLGPVVVWLVFSPIGSWIFLEMSQFKFGLVHLVILFSSLAGLNAWYLARLLILRIVSHSRTDTLGKLYILASTSLAIVSLAGFLFVAGYHIQTITNVVRKIRYKEIDPKIGLRRGF